MEIDAANGLPGIANAYIGFFMAALWTMVCFVVVARGPACQKIFAELFGRWWGGIGMAIAYVFAYVLPAYITLHGIHLQSDNLLKRSIMQEWATYGGILGVAISGIVIWWIDRPPIDN